MTRFDFIITCNHDLTAASLINISPVYRSQAAL